MGLGASFRKAAGLIFRHPKLLVPKALLAVGYGLLLLQTADLAKRTVLSSSGVSLGDASAVLVQSLVLFGLTLLMVVVDLWVACWYPALVVQFHRGERVSFRNAVRSSQKRFWVAFPLLLGLELVVSLLLGLFSVPAFLGFGTGDFPWMIVLVVGVVFVLWVALFPLLSVSVLESGSVGAVLSRTLSLSRRFWDEFSLAAVVPWALSLLSVLVAFLAESTGAFLVFWLVRAGVVLLATYYAVFNPTVYLDIVRRDG